MTQLEKALTLCKEAHKGQFRHDGTTPYHTHPIAVSELMDTEDEKIVALLHDVLEDTDMTSSILKHSGFSPGIINSIEWLTRIKGESYEDYIRNLSCCNVATKVKIADMFHNMSGTPSESQKKRYFKSLKYLLKDTK